MAVADAAPVAPGINGADFEDATPFKLFVGQVHLDARRERRLLLCGWRHHFFWSLNPHWP